MIWAIAARGSGRESSNVRQVENPSAEYSHRTKRGDISLIADSVAYDFLVYVKIFRTLRDNKLAGTDNACR
ncbi:hypothetical protein C7B77_15820 [Chamaesiphon polymorphus CCALA 037]|uniref:Uncharacterized protein n=1 Tax=Chamaesiphon polymorphus CCALA 037 TaxID=2107692 RepID=A0A2T1GCN8_9CYAN|nr:hypothetical protein C7B77_15820 [Chamaesiphon polymorphus CCALA 037]